MRGAVYRMPGKILFINRNYLLFFYFHQVSLSGIFHITLHALALLHHGASFLIDWDFPDSLARLRHRVTLSLLYRAPLSNALPFLRLFHPSQHFLAGLDVDIRRQIMDLLESGGKTIGKAGGKSARRHE